MAKPIIWQNKAVDQFENIQEYLLSEWGESVVISFTQQVFQVLELLSRYPKIGPMEVPERNIRGYVVNKQITILYQEFNLPTHFWMAHAFHHSQNRR